MAYFASASSDQLLIWGLVSGSVLLLVYGIYGFVVPADPVDRRLGAAAAAGESAPLRRENNGRLARVDRFTAPKDAAQRSRIRLRMHRAGYRGDHAIRSYYLIKAGLGLGASLLAAVAIGALKPDLPPAATLGATVAACLIGFVVPSVWLSMRTEQRDQAIRHAFPDALDLMLVCVEAGLGLDQAIARVTTEIGHAYPELAGEMRTICDELRAGKERREVLRDFGQRIDIDDVRSFVTVLNQADQFGTSIGDALRVYAAEMRFKRLVRAEERANKLPLKLTLATMVFTMPPTILILAGPSFITIMRTLAGFLR